MYVCLAMLISIILSVVMAVVAVYLSVLICRRLPVDVYRFACDAFVWLCLLVCLHVSFCLSACLFISPYIYLFVRLSVNVVVYQFSCSCPCCIHSVVCVCLFVFLSQSAHRVPVCGFCMNRPYVLCALNAVMDALAGLMICD